MKKFALTLICSFLISSAAIAGDRSIEMISSPADVLPGDTIFFECNATGEWLYPLTRAKIQIINPQGDKVVRRQNMDRDGLQATFEYTIPEDEQSGSWKFKCILKDGEHRQRKTMQFAVLEDAVQPSPIDPIDPVDPVDPTDPTDPADPPDGGYFESSIAAHNTMTSYNGPATCIECHQNEADEMLDSLHMKWSGPTPELTNTNGEELGKAIGGINTFCTYAMSSRGACFSCHVRADGNAPHPPQAEDVDCLMCHSDTYQRKFVADPDNSETVTNIMGEEKTYIFGKVDDQGNYTTVPNYDKMPPGTHMVNVARSVTMPSNKACLRCHATAGGGDWTKRGDLGLSSANASFAEDVHLAQDGANLSCADCHSALNHKISGRGIDLRQTEAPVPTCNACHGDTPHSSSTINRHAQGQISCQTCHNRKFAKGGATEMSRDWQYPVWNEAFCSGQGGFVGHEVKETDVTPEYVWFDGTSYVYNVGETIEADERGVYPMAKAHGSPFDGKAKIFPIKRHATIMPLHESGKMVPPVIMWMFMTGDFDIAVQKGMEEQGMTGNYSIVEADAEMLITHGVDPKQNAPSCAECHNGSGTTPDGAGMLPLAELGYHTFPAAVKNCNLCHEQKSMNWESMHSKHRNYNLSCTSCHPAEPTGLNGSRSQLCSSCHEYKSWKSEGHKKHIEKRVECSTCHSFT